MADTRILLISNYLSPYRIPVLREIALEPGIDFLGCYLGQKDKSRKWETGLTPESVGFNFSFLPGYHFFYAKLDWSTHINFGLFWYFLKYRPHVVVCTGYDNLAFFFAVFYAKLMGCKLVLWSGSCGYREITKKPLVRKIKERFISSFDAYLAYGAGARDFLVDHGAPPEKIALGFNTVNIGFFMRESERCRQDGSLEALKKEYPGKNILCITRFLGAKTPDILIDALSKMKNQDFRCLLLGWGPEENFLRNKIKELNLENRVVFLGYHEAEQIARFNTLADVFVLPSHREPWGLVVNEAMACGTPVVVSRGAGCWMDLIEEGQTGFSYPAGESGMLAEILDRLMADEKLRKSTGKKGKEKIKAFTPRRYAEGFLRAVRDL